MPIFSENTNTSKYISSPKVFNFDYLKNGSKDLVLDIVKNVSISIIMNLYLRSYSFLQMYQQQQQQKNPNSQLEMGKKH